MTERLTPDQLLGERIAGRFIVERQIGSGPLSSAFRARDERLHRRVTVKLFHPQHPDDIGVVDAQLELAKSVARLSHPNIATVIDRGEHEGMPFIVLEYVRGENLQERIDRYAPLRVAEVVELGQSIARALTYAHAHGVAHGNLRPENVLISEEREVKLVDFGGGSWLAALAGNGSAYIAPERADGGPDAEPAGVADDVYALGVVLFVALTEREPEPNIDASRVQLLRPDVSPRLASAVARALARDPQDRHGSMRELISDLSSVRVPVIGEESPAPASSSTDQPTGLLETVQPLEAPPARANGRPTEASDELRRETRPRRQRPPRRTDRARLLVWGMVLLPVAAVVMVGLMLAGERGEKGKTGDSRPRAVSAQPRPVKIARADAFDPFGNPPGIEKNQDAANVFDGNPATAWSTEGYDVADMSKDGVGIWVQLAGRHEIQDVRITSDPQGWQATIYAADQPVDTLDGWKAVSSSTAVVNGKRIAVDTEGRKYAAYLVWITRLSIDTTEDSDGRHRAHIAEIQLRAA